jgi:secondary thiamine-phosphate synthase enzyme
MVFTSAVEVRTRGEGDVLDLTPEVRAAISRSKLRDGIACVFVVGSTAAITTIEFEPGLVEDVAVALERVAPEDARYAHEARWGDDNGHSHVRAALIGPSVCIPIVDGALVLGTWQQVVLCELDTRGRERKVVVQVVGK